MELKLRATMIEGKPYFVAQDIAQIVGINLIAKDLMWSPHEAGDWAYLIPEDDVKRLMGDKEVISKSLWDFFHDTTCPICTKTTWIEVSDRGMKIMLDQG